MADLLASNVTIIKTFPWGGINGKRGVCIKARYTATTAGGAANRLLASAFGLREIEDCSHVLLDAATKQVFPAVPSADGSLIYLSNPVQATDANRADAADMATGANNAYVTLYGYR